MDLTYPRAFRLLRHVDELGLGEVVVTMFDWNLRVGRCWGWDGLGLPMANDMTEGR
jgi:hypothetical protein